ncbi:MAG: putative membrane protein YedE/YeeE [Candidatus Azotimanducaceae bacterium]|jgi:uncharacterized membrane protein YedE/YeeE
MKYIPQTAMYMGGIVFGFGLAFSGAARPEVVLSFLNLEDLGLLFVIGSALIVTLITIQIIPRIFTKPIFSKQFNGHEGLPVTRRSTVGAVIFGVGWGISGLCPATSFAAIGMGNIPILIGVLGMFIGALVYGTIRSKSGVATND